MDYCRITVLTNSQPTLIEFFFMLFAAIIESQLKFVMY